MWTLLPLEVLVRRPQDAKKHVWYEEQTIYIVSSLEFVLIFGTGSSRVRVQIDRGA